MANTLARENVITVMSLGIMQKLARKSRRRNSEQCRLFNYD